MEAFLHVMVLPFLACLVLTGIHAYLGFHVIERQVIFVDLALAQMAALGASVAIVLGCSFESPQSYWLSLGFTMIGALIFSLTRLRKERVPQEAVIGITYAVAAAALVLILSRSGEGDEHIKQVFMGNILLVSQREVVKIAVIYAVVGFLHFLFRRQFFLISRDPQQAFTQKLNVRFWDFLFYVLFGFVVTSSVKIAGVLLVLAFLIVPPVCAMFLSTRIRTRLIVGWSVGALASLAGILISYYWDFPTAPSVVCVLGAFFFLLMLVQTFLPKTDR